MADKITSSKKSKGEKTPEQKPTPQELPGIIGKGVEIVKIPELDKALRKWEKHKEARCAETPHEVSAKQDAIAEFHKHEDKIPKDSEGNLIYRMGDLVYKINHVFCADIFAFHFNVCRILHQRRKDFPERLRNQILVGL